MVLEVNVDDVTGEVIAHTIAALLSAGAFDAWATPIVMKKGRPAHTVHALCDPIDAAVIGEVLLRETGSLGVRGTTLMRWPQRRDEATVVAARSPDPGEVVGRSRQGRTRRCRGCRRMRWVCRCAMCSLRPQRLASD